MATFPYPSPACMRCANFCGAGADQSRRAPGPSLTRQRPYGNRLVVANAATRSDAGHGRWTENLLTPAFPIAVLNHDPASKADTSSNSSRQASASPLRASKRDPAPTPPHTPRTSCTVGASVANCSGCDHATEVVWSLESASVQVRSGVVRGRLLDRIDRRSELARGRRTDLRCCRHLALDAMASRQMRAVRSWN